ncbi:catalase [Vibrio vulnificus]|uniref:catalase n=1 Tax=Vibrio vulnificus TaxID=672 RepID=UPI001A2548BD|nr:catalase [Vibrio vulnificus]MCU8122678.1 catalase [Vibrio vulnificus]MCU8300775.1 catalase [Vibrio vulnificus]MDK2638077.1 catalase [Vibrio vulnificus]MDK2646119.1 catalase [Vibrio vulnificus]MDK2663998.1 catalase [Vibrio vulnificus]
MHMSKSFLLISMGLVSISVHAQTLTRDNGAPVGDNQNSITAGENGSVLLQDVHLIQKLQRFARERIPERVVHARGTGAHGEFVASGDFSELTLSSPFAQSGKVTPVFVRFSTVIHSKGSPETLRDPRGFATKFYTDQGNWDLVGNNLPVFFIRDSIKFPDMVHSLKPSPVTNLQDPNRFFDFFSSQPSATNMLTWVYTNLGTPASYRTMDGFGVHAYKWINQKGEVNYVKFHWKSQQGVKSLRPAEVTKVQGEDFNHLTNDLYTQINAGNFPKWDLYVKVLSPKALSKLDYNGLDATKVWLDVPEKKVGTMTLNRVPDNFFLETEQSAFAPSNIIPGIEPSEDRLLQGRLFAYADTQLYRLGANLFQLPVNSPKSPVANHNQDGPSNNSTGLSDATGLGNVDSLDVNYEPSRLVNLTVDKQARAVETPLSGHVQQQAIRNPRDFFQAGVLYRSLSEQDKADLIHNLSGDLNKVNDAEVKAIMVSYFYRADKEYGTRLAKATDVNLKQVTKLASM